MICHGFGTRDTQPRPQKEKDEEAIAEVQAHQRKCSNGNSKYQNVHSNGKVT